MVLRGCDTIATAGGSPLEIHTSDTENANAVDGMG